jgi:hypothetical protein
VNDLIRLYVANLRRSPKPLRTLDHIEWMLTSHVGAPNAIPASAYIVCDITPSMHKVLAGHDAFATPDKQGYFGFH